MECRDIERFVDAFIDGEFAEAERTEMERHLAGCPSCRRLVQERASFKTTVRLSSPRLSAPAFLRQRLDVSLNRADHEKGAPATSALATAVRAQEAGKRSPARWALPLVALLLPLALWLEHQPESPMIADSVIRHQRNLPAEISGDRRVVLNWFDGKVPFAVRAPRLEPMASLRGGRLSNIGNREAAYLIYDGQGSKISVFVFDPEQVSLVTPRRQVIGSQVVYLQGQKGYNVALFQHQGLGYAITGNLEESDLIRLISSAVNGR